MALTHDWINETDAAVDEKLGLVTIKLPFSVSPGLTKIATLKHALTFLPEDMESIGLPMVKRNLKERKDGGYDVNFDFDGHFHPSEANGEEFSLDGTTNDEKIEAHPEIASLVAQFYPGKTLADAQDDKGEIHFPATIPAGGGTGSAFGGSVESYLASSANAFDNFFGSGNTDEGDSDQVPNPMHGIRTYLEPALVWSKTWVSQTLPPWLERQLGCIGTPPSGRLGQKPPSGREWILGKCRADWRGNIYKIFEYWIQAGRGGFPPVYKYRS